jgi:hypothetical protein
VLSVLVFAASAAQAQLFAGVGNGSPVNAGALLILSETNGAGTVVGDAVTPGGLAGLAFDSNNILFGVTRQGSDTSSNLVRISPQTGTSETIGPMRRAARNPE